MQHPIPYRAFTCKKSFTDSDNVFLVIRVIRLSLASILATGLLVAAEVKAADQGSLDETFGSGGAAEVNIVNQDQAKAAVRLADGSILVAGSTNQDALIVKLTATGGIDGTFGGGDGVVLTSLGLGENGDAWEAIGVQASGKIIVAGRNGSKSITVARFNSDGSVDESFGASGAALVNLGGTSSDYGDEVYGLTVANDGRIILTGAAVIPRGGIGAGTRSILGIARLTELGNYDSSFSDDGRFTADCGFDLMLGRRVEVDSQGRIVVAGGLSAAGPVYGCLLRLSQTGVPDTEFGSAGFVATSTAYFEDFRLQLDDKLIVVYTYQQGGTASTRIARYGTAGLLDPSFGSGGVVEVRSSGVQEHTPRLALQTDGKIVVGATNVNYSQPNRMVVRRFSTSGVEDTSHLSGLYTNWYGPVIIGGSTVGSGNWSLQSVLSTADRIVVVGQRNYPDSPYDINLYLASVIAAGVRTDPATAAVQASKSVVLTAEEVTFDASESTTTSGVKTFAWDLDNDEVFETDTGATATIKKAWDSVGEKTVKVRVTSGSGLVATASAAVEVRLAPPAGEAGISIADGVAYTTSKNVKVNLVWPALATQARISNDGGFSAAKTTTVPLTSSVDWDLDDTVSGEYTKIVYVRFSGSGIDSTKTYTDDIIFDNRPPAVSSSSVQQSGTFLVITLAAKDDESGLATVDVNNADKTVSSDYASTVLVNASDLGLGVSATSVRVSRLDNLRIRIVDKAGNKTTWISLGGSSAPAATPSAAGKSAPTSGGVPGLTSTNAPSAAGKSAPTSGGVPGLTSTKNSLSVNSALPISKVLSNAGIKRPRGGTVALLSASRNCRVVGSRVFALKVGTCTLRARISHSSKKVYYKSVRLVVLPR